MIEDETAEVQQRVRVVAFGASAGGLQALRPIIHRLEPGGKVAYLVAQHMAPNQPTSLVSLLAAQSQLPVLAAGDGETLQADHVYVCPPGYDIGVSGGQVALSATLPGASFVPSIDRLFRSLAEESGDQTVAVILSGSGQDGVLGAESINTADGIVIVQIPEEALQPSMPQAAIGSGFADLVGNVEEIAAWLNDIDHLAELVGPAGADASTKAFGLVFERVAQATGLDLSQYKENTLRRQTVRRYRALGIKTLERYLDYLQEHPEELFTLQQSYMISVSSFFRDPDVFVTLEKTLRKLVSSKQAGDSLRVWVPACATGEEAYSIAILIAEILGDRLGQMNVRLFATDIDQNALDFARAGVYSASGLVQLTAARLHRWFSPEGSGWRIDKAIREMCVFSHHDVIAHPPFIKIDLVSCRNLLIYFKSEQQSELISTFHYGLNADGLLLLGKSEAAGFNSRLFETIDGSHKLYRRRNGTSTHPARYARYGMLHPVSRPLLPVPTQTPQRQTLVEASLATIAKAYGPPGVLVNASFEPMHFFGNSQRYFALPGDHADFSVFSLCLPNLRSELKALCYRLVQENLDALVGVGVDLVVEGDRLRVRPVLRRIAAPNGNEEFAFLISFEETHALGGGIETGVKAVEDARTEEIVRLRQELADSREHLQAVIEELEASNEELQSLNEEVQSSSEELQSSNEELQSSNEELTTLNDELRIKSQEALQLTTTIGNIQNSIRTSLVVVDHDGRITRFNALATRIFGLVPNDVGQFLYGVPCHLQLPQLRQQVGQVIAQGTSLVEQVRQGEFHYLMQIDPYLDELGGLAGAVLTFADISDLHRAEQAQQSSEIRFRQVWEASLDGLLVVDAQMRVVLANPTFEAMFGYAKDELVGAPLEVLVPESARARHVEQSLAFMAQPGQTRSLNRERNIHGLRRDGREFPVEISLSSMIVEGEHYVLAAVVDITERKAAERAVRESEERLRFALDAAHAGTWEWRLASNENIWSDEIWNLYGLPRQDAAPSFEVWLETVHPQDRDRVVAAIADAAGRSSEFETEWQVNLPEGSPARYLLSRGRPALGADGRPTHYIGIVLDISARKCAESELEGYRDRLEELVRQRTAQLSELYNRAPCGYHSLDADGVFVNINDTELAWLGYAREELIGCKRVLDIMSPQSQKAFKASYPEFMKRGELSGAGLEFEFRRKDGSFLPVLLNAKAVYDANGQFSHTLSTIIDNTERKRAEKAWAEAQEAAESANRAKSAFLANMSHEIRTPLNAIIGLGYLLRRGNSNPVQVEQLDKIDAAAQHLLSVISDILDLSKIEANKLVLNESDFDLHAVADNVVSMLLGRAQGKGLALTLDYESLGHLVRGDATRFTQALLNLASNAVKFTPAGLITIRLRKVEEAAGLVLVRVEIEDSGIGIPADVLPKLFSPFEQGDASYTRKHGGTGLGLAITKRLAELMGGDAGASSELGRGSTFWFSAWLKVAGVVSPTRTAGENGGQAESALQSRHSGARVLLVEDEPINQEVAEMFLSAVGFDVALASNGAEAVKQAAQRPFALVLMDMQMPVMDGLEATQRIRELPGCASMPIVAMTANAFSEDRARCLAVGMNDFISKPFTPEKFYATLLRWLDEAARAGVGAEE